MWSYLLQLQLLERAILHFARAVRQEATGLSPTQLITAALSGRGLRSSLNNAPPVGWSCQYSLVGYPQHQPFTASCV